MVEAMGGADSEGYRAFCAHACEAYNILRKSASLILSLFHLMAGAAIPDVRADPEKVILKLQARPLPGPHTGSMRTAAPQLDIVVLIILMHVRMHLVTWCASWQLLLSKSYAGLH